jgi:hypothetical protein
MRRVGLWAGAALLLTLGLPTASSARRQGDLRYSFEQVWNASLRMVRVDMRLPVTDRDQEAGYLLFDYLEHGKRFPGSLELVRGEQAQRPLTKIVIQVQGMPSYVEQMLYEKLSQKLRSEFGEPIEGPRPPAQKPKAPEKKPEVEETPSVPDAPSHDGLAPDS